MPETGLNFYTEDKGIWFCSSEDKYIRLIKKLAKENPGQVDIIKEPEQNGGMLYCEIPKSWLRIKPPTKRDLTEEERAEIGRRLNASKNNAEYDG